MLWHQRTLSRRRRVELCAPAGRHLRYVVEL